MKKLAIIISVALFFLTTIVAQADPIKYHVSESDIHGGYIVKKIWLQTIRKIKTHKNVIASTERIFEYGLRARKT